MKKVAKWASVFMSAMLIGFVSCSSDDSGGGETAGEKGDSVYKFHNTVTYLAAGTDGTAGTEGTYVYFGDWPQTIKAQHVTVDETKSVTMGCATYYLGSDNNYYAKCRENALGDSNIYSDGTAVANADSNSEKYFKVEPIKWRILNPNESGNKILLAEKILTANVAYYDYSDVNRIINGKKVHPNNYEHSKIRAYLNGLSYEKKESDSAEQIVDSTYASKGFLQTAFMVDALALIGTTTVDNSAASTNPALNPSLWNCGINDYICDDTEDKIFLLSEKEVTTSGYGFADYDVHGNGNNRIRVTTDYAKANYSEPSKLAAGGVRWWLRSPYPSSDGVRVIDDEGYYASPLVKNSLFGVVPALSIIQENKAPSTPVNETITLANITVSVAPSKILYYQGEAFDDTGLMVKAFYSDGTSKIVTGWTTSGFTSENIDIDGKLLISYTEDNITKTAATPYYVASLNAKPTETPVVLTDYTGTLEGGIYYKFGDFPQTIAASSVTFSDVPVYKGYFLGSDGYFYAKCREKAYYTGYSYSDGTAVARFDDKSDRCFRVEPIVWRVLNPNESGNKILLAEKGLIPSVTYYDNYDVNRTINEKAVYPNNYEHSKIRAYLNGLSYVKKESDSAEQITDSFYNGRGFLQTAFTADAQALIAVTTVDNSAASTNPASNSSEWDNGINEYACDDTEDKIFLLSEKEVTTSGYGFTEYDVEESGNSRIKEPSDYVKANYVEQDPVDEYVGCLWWLRSSNSDSSERVQIVDVDGSAFNCASVKIKYFATVPALSISLSD